MALIRLSRPSLASSTKPHHTHFLCPFSTRAPLHADFDYPSALPTSQRPKRNAPLPPSSQPISPSDTILNIQNRATRSKNTASIRASLAQKERAQSLQKQLLRRWTRGDIYAPHDLSSIEMEKHHPRTLTNSDPTAPPASSKIPRRDVFELLGMNPLQEYKNFSIMGEFVTSMGRIKPRRVTGLTAVNQRRIAKAVRRAVGLGLLPSVHKHPEMLERERRRVEERWWGKDGRGDGNGGFRVARSGR